jgi:hypothetical protein
MAWSELTRLLVQAVVIAVVGAGAFALATYLLARF